MEFVTHILKQEDFWEGLGLLIVIAIFLWWRVPAFLAAALDRRAEGITKELEQASQIRKEAEQVLIEYRQKATAAKSEAEHILRETKAEAERYAAEARAQLDAQLKRRAELAEQQIAQAEARAMAEIRATAANAAAAAAEKLIAAHLDDSKSRALVEGSIKDLASKLN
jgi:F-type H+-transporting ATPase subunit b